MVNPVIIVASAAHRNQNNAAGAISLLIAGFSLSGIFDIEGIWTKLKYQSKPIHITPLITWSQREKKDKYVGSKKSIILIDIIY